MPDRQTTLMALAATVLPSCRTMLAVALIIAANPVPRTWSSEVDAGSPERKGVLVSGMFRAPLQIIAAGAPSIGDRPPDILAPSAESGLASRIVAAEGGPGMNPASSAAGYGQFLRGTWLEMFVRTYPQLAQKLNSDQILALREVKPLALELTSRYAQENASSLRRVGLPPTEASLSLAHAVGPGGAINILVSRHDKPVASLLSPEAIAANPFMREMTAGTLQQWAMNRVRLPTEPPQPKRATAPVPDEIEALKPSENFWIDGQTKASQAVVENRKAIAALQNFLDAASKIGGGTGTPFGQPTQVWLSSIGIDPTELLVADPAAVRIFNKHANRLVLNTIKRVAARPAYREFKFIESNAGPRGQLQLSVVRDVASALIGKMQRENDTIVAVVRHRRGWGA